MRLTTISELQQPDLKPLLEIIQQLGDQYTSFISQDNQGYEFKVWAGSEDSRAPGIHASECSGCMRRLVYGAMGTERRPDPTTTDANMKMRFRIGTCVHAQVQDELRRLGEKTKKDAGDSGVWFEFNDEIRLSPELQELSAEHNIHSSCDGIFTFYRNENGKGSPIIRCGLEIKTMSYGEFEKLNNPKLDHVEQTHVYMAALDLPLLWFLYYNKSNSNFTKPYAPFLMRFNQTAWNKLEFRFVKANHMAATNQLPAREEGKACTWCPFSYTCAPLSLNRGSKIQNHSAGMRRR